MAETLRRLLRIVLTLAAFGMRPAVGAEAAAIVTDVRGEARLADGSAVELLRELPAGAEVRLSASAQLVLIHLRAQASYSLSGPGSYVVRAHEVETSAGGRGARATTLPAAFQGVRLQPARIAQASMAMRGGAGEQQVRLRSPVATWLLARPDALRWEQPTGVGAIEFAVQLTDSENRPLFAARTHATELALPPGLALEPGRLYGWQVQAMLTDGRALVGWSEFGLAEEAVLARASAARPPQDASVAARIGYALLLEALGLREAAQGQWAEAARARPHDAQLRELSERR
jgi:hypothetical protein